MTVETNNKNYPVKELAKKFGRTPQAMMWFINKYEIDVILVPRGKTMKKVLIPEKEISKIAALISAANERKVWNGLEDRREYHRLASRKSYLKKKTRNSDRFKINKDGELANMNERNIAFDYNGIAKRCEIKGGDLNGKILIEYFIDGISYMKDVTKDSLLCITDQEIEDILLIKKQKRKNV